MQAKVKAKALIIPLKKPSRLMPLGKKQPFPLLAANWLTLRTKAKLTLMLRARKLRLTPKTRTRLKLVKPKPLTLK